METYFLEGILAVLITFIYFKREKPLFKYLLWGYVAFFISLLLQFPFKYLQVNFFSSFETNILPVFLILFFGVVISEVTKYFALKKFVKTKSYKNGVFFAIGWSTVESINYFSILFYTFFLSLVGLSFNYLTFIPESLPLFSFMYFFMINISLTVLVIFSIIKRNFYYLLGAVIYNLIVIIGLYLFEGVGFVLFLLLTFVYSLYIVYNYRKIR